jgi:hypothetical protein
MTTNDGEGRSLKEKRAGLETMYGHPTTTATTTIAPLCNNDNHLPLPTTGHQLAAPPLA